MTVPNFPSTSVVHLNCILIARETKFSLMMALFLVCPSLWQVDCRGSTLWLWQRLAPNSASKVRLKRQIYKYSVQYPLLGKSCRREICCTCEFLVQKHLQVPLAVRVRKIIEFRSCKWQSAFTEIFHSCVWGRTSNRKRGRISATWSCRHIEREQGTITRMFSMVSWERSVHMTCKQ